MYQVQHVWLRLDVGAGAEAEEPREGSFSKGNLAAGVEVGKPEDDGVPAHGPPTPRPRTGLGILGWASWKVLRMRRTNMEELGKILGWALRRRLGKTVETWACS